MRAHNLECMFRACAKMTNAVERDDLQSVGQLMKMLEIYIICILPAHRDAMLAKVEKLTPRQQERLRAHLIMKRLQKKRVRGIDGKRVCCSTTLTHHDTKVHEHEQM